MKYRNDKNKILNNCYFLERKAKGGMGDIVFDAGYFQAHSFMGDGEFVRTFIILKISTCLNH